MANIQNLKKPYDSNQNREEASRNGKKGGKRSGEVRRQKADMRKAMQAMLENTFTDKSGKQITGLEIIMNGIIKNLSDPKSRNWAKSVDLAIQLSGANMSAEQLEKQRAEIELIRAKTAAISGGAVEEMQDDGFMDALGGIAREVWKDGGSV